MPVRTDEREYRFLTPLLPAGDAASKRFASDYYVEGYATTWENRYEFKPGVFEVMKPGVLEGADLSDVVMQRDHVGSPVARMKGKQRDSLVIEPDHRGVFIAADLSRSENARALYEEIGGGLFDVMSWGFIIGEETYDKTTRTYTVTRIKKVFDVSVVTFAANDATEISARARVEGVIESERQELLARRARIIALKSKL